MSSSPRSGGAFRESNPPAAAVYPSMHRRKAVSTLYPTTGVLSMRALILTVALALPGHPHDRCPLPGSQDVLPNSPCSFALASQYAACAASGVAKYPKCLPFPSTAICARHFPSRLAHPTPFSPLVLCAGFLVLCWFCDLVAMRKFSLLLSSPSPEIWSTSRPPGSPIMTLCILMVRGFSPDVSTLYAYTEPRLIRAFHL